MSEHNIDSESRREFFKSSGALVVSASLPWMASAAQAAQQGAASKPPLKADELDSWIAIEPNGQVNAFYGKVDLGQGLEVAIGQIVAEELDVPFGKVRIIMGDTASSMNQGGASSALGIQAGAKPLRNAAAEARRLLLAMAAQHLGVSDQSLQVLDGVVSVVGDASKKVSYAELIGGRYFNAKVEWNKKIGNPLDVKGLAKPKKPSEYKLVGKPIPRTDVAGKVFGSAPYIGDVMVPGMLHARMIRAPHVGGTVQAVDEASISSVPGARVVREKNFLAVVAEKEWDAVRAAQLLKVTWSAPLQGVPTHENVHAFIRQAPTLKQQDELKVGDTATALGQAVRVVEAEYLWPFQSHASMGPASAIAEVKPEGVTLWTGSQKPHFARDGVAKLLGLPPEKVHAKWTLGPGSYGRNDAGDAAMDAAMLSKLTGRPVRVQGMRQNATAWDPKAPASVHRARAALDANGKVVAYDFISRGFSRADIVSNESDPHDSLVGMELGLAPKTGLGFGIPAESYGFEHKRLGWEVIPPLHASASPMRTSHMRDPVGLQIQFASEQFIDELAYATQADPVAFRLQYLKNPRDREVVSAAAQKAGWQARPAASVKQTGDLLRGRGIAYAQRGGTIVAVVAEIEVDRKTGRIWGRKFSVGHDCGLVINPRSLRATIEGGMVQALSRTLYEEVQFDAKRVGSVDWQSYPILSLPDTPESIEIVMLNRPELPPTGAGEATSRIVPAAVANAFFDATGVRLRQAPLTPQRVLAALQKA